MKNPEWITDQFLQAYLQYTEHTEPPKMFHIWAALSGIAACMSRHVWLETGIGNMYGNMYVLLVGPPGTRKSTAINLAVALMRDNTQVKFAPEDTSGQRQGLIAAMVGEEDTLDADLAMLDVADEITQITMLGKIPMSLNSADVHSMHVVASEFGIFIGQNNLDLTRFLLKMWDGENYTYRLKTSECNLQNPLLNLIGGTTPTEISTLLPPEAMGQGFMSRIILTYSPNKYKKLPLSKVKLDVKIKPKLVEVYTWVSNAMQGPMTMSSEAESYLDSIYMDDIRIQDSRFIYYTERRHTHLLKLCMALAAANKRYVVELCDAEQAEAILSYTEESMPEALGEYGLSPLATAKQRMAEFIQHAKGPVTDRVLWIVMQRDIKLIDFRNALSEMINAGKIIQIDTKLGKAFIYNDATYQAIDALAEDSVESSVDDWEMTSDE